MPKRNLDRMRELLLIAENATSDSSDYGDCGLLNFDETMESADQEPLNSDDEYQLWLMAQSGWIEPHSSDVRYFRISPIGHDYLDAIRDEGIWKRTKEAVRETGGSATLEIVKSLATGFLKQKISQHTRIEL